MTDRDHALDAGPSVVLIGGPGGSGTSGVAARLAAHLDARGTRVALADLDPWNGATTRLGDADVELLGPTVGADALAPAQSLLDRVGLDPRIAQETVRLPGTDTFEILHRIALAAARTDLDVVVADLGSRVVDVVEVAHRARWMAGHLLRAQRGWLATARPRTAGLVGLWPGASGHAVAQRFSEHAAHWLDIVATAQVHLVAQPDDPRLRRLRMGLALHELEPTCDRAEEAVPWPGEPASARATLTGNDDGWTWSLRLPGLRSQELRVDRSGDDLALDVLGVRRLVVLPTALRRFRTDGARLAAEHLEISFVPEESST